MLSDFFFLLRESLRKYLVVWYHERPLWCRSAWQISSVHTLSRNDDKLVRHDLPFRKPCCEFLIKQFCSGISPVYNKSGGRTTVNNYRPISLTSQISKVIEAVLRDAITAHLEQNCLIRDSQHGFRKGRSCLTNLLSFLDKVTDYVNEGTNIDIIYLDFAKAFDKVPHHRLLQKLKAHGINGKIWNWIRAWLTNRKQRVCIKGKSSIVPGQKYSVAFHKVRSWDPYSFWYTSMTWKKESKTGF